MEESLRIQYLREEIKGWSLYKLDWYLFMEMILKWHDLNYMMCDFKLLIHDVYWEDREENYVIE